jgi:hypothetical protein
VQLLYIIVPFISIFFACFLFSKEVVQGENLNVSALLDIAS